MTIHWEGDYELDGKDVVLVVEGEWCIYEIIDGYRYGSDYEITKAQAFDGDGKEIQLTPEQFKAIADGPKIYELIEDDWCAQAEAWEERKYYR